jgi:hypothetical protein
VNDLAMTSSVALCCILIYAFAKGKVDQNYKNEYILFGVFRLMRTFFPNQRK